MRLVSITGSLVHGGAERQAITLVNRLAERGHECHAVYVKDDPSQLARLRLAAPSQAHCLHARRYLDPAAVARLGGLMRALQPSVVLATNAYALLYAALTRGGAPLVVTLHSTYLKTAKEQLKMIGYRPLFWSAQAAVFVCEQSRRHWRRRAVFGRRNAVIYNGIDPAYWQPDAEAAEQVRRAAGFERGDFVIGLSAVLRPEKNPVQLVEALARLRNRGVRAKALIIGDGPQRDAVLDRAAALGVRPHLVVTGLREDVRPYVSACDALALTSFTEALSLAALEGMALGRPVVHPDVGGARELIDDGSDGLLFPVGDTAALTRALERLAAGETRRALGRRARAKVESRFSEQAMVERYERLFCELAPPGRVRPAHALGARP